MSLAFPQPDPLTAGVEALLREAGEWTPPTPAPEGLATRCLAEPAVATPRRWALPSIAWVPLSIVWFGFSEASLLFVTIIGSLFAVTVSVADALRTVPPIYLKAARNMGCDGMDLILRVTVPATLPHLISSAKVGWSFAWRSLVGAEVIFATVGLGFLVESASEAPNIAQVMAVMFVILVLGVLVDRVVFSRSQEWVSRRWGLTTGK